MSEEINGMEKEKRLQRIRFLVDQSKLYAQFLSDSIQPVENENENKNKNMNGDSNDHKQDENTQTVDPPPTKRSRRTRKDAEPVSQPSIKEFFKANTKTPKEQPKSIVVPLHPHQISALKWLIMLYEQGLNGILADEMGLGKTLEVIAFLAFLLENGAEGPFLVLAPLSTIGNWCDEIQRFAPSLTYTKYYGSPAERTKLRRAKSKWGDIIITSYETIMADAQYLQRVGWKYIIVDEGHRLKNIDSKLMRVLKNFSSANRMLLTGTPLQNNLVELWALLNFLLPDVFTDLDIFHTWFESGEAQVDENVESGLVTSLHDILRPFLLRRLKKDVGLNLPPKREYVIFAGLTTLQQNLYQSLLDGTAREFVTQQIIENDRKGKSQNVETLVKAAKQMLRGKSFANLVMQLRLCCNSPYLFWDPWAATTETNTNSLKIDKRIEETSGKLQILHQIMQKLKAGGHKVLIFTQFTKMLDVLEDWAHYRKYKYCRLDGSTSQEDRQDMIREFSGNLTDVDLFMLTTRSGGQGVNLVGADTVILFDSDWNPQQDLQAMDRVHRIGQNKPIIVIRLCVGDTVEQDLLERASQKLELNHLVIESGQFKGPTLTNSSTEQKIADMSAQLHRHRLKFEDKSAFKLTQNEFNKILDRSPAAYESAIEDPRVSEHVICVKSEL